MKSFKEFREDFKDELFTSGTADLYAYMAYCQGYAEGMKENLNNMLSAPITMPTTMPNIPLPQKLTRPTCDIQAQLLHEEAEKIEEK